MNKETYLEALKNLANGNKIALEVLANLSDEMLEDLLWKLNAEDLDRHYGNKK